MNFFPVLPFVPPQGRNFHFLLGGDFTLPTDNVPVMFPAPQPHDVHRSAKLLQEDLPSRARKGRDRRHDLAHLTAYLCLSSRHGRADIRMVQEIMGHKTLAMTIEVFPPVERSYDPRRSTVFHRGKFRNEPTPRKIPFWRVSYRCLKRMERDMGFEPTTFSLGS